ncbi:MAG: DUF3047 domain-containing protein [Geobacteraceae bacterium]|nr:DUF3047 domain-containing protein [Geobacteraceae bacterium]
MKLFAFIAIILFSLTAIAYADTVAVSRFESDGFAGWERKTFRGETEYSLVREDGTTVIKAHSRAAGSGMFKKVQLDTLQYRYLRWKWKVSEPIGNGAEKTRAGDDYSARVYVIFPGFFFWQMKAINYVWAGRLPREESFPNPYTRNAMMVVVESGAEKAGTWVTEQRDILADYRRLFGSEPRRLGAIAIMTDTDNTGSEATAWYGDIAISSLPFSTK